MCHPIAALFLTRLICTSTQALPPWPTAPSRVCREVPRPKQAMACNTPLQTVPDAVLHETYLNDQPQTRRPCGVMEWPGLLRMLDRMDPTYRN